MATNDELMAQELNMALSSGVGGAINEVIAVYNDPDFNAASGRYLAGESLLPKAGGSSGSQTRNSAPVTTSVPAQAFSAVEMLDNLLFSAIGVKGLGSWAAGLYNRGAKATEIVQALRYGTDTSEAGKQARASYLEAFPKMDTFIKEGIFAGESPEAQYQQYRNTVKESAARYGVDPSLVDNNKIAEYITNRTSAAELTQRMNTAATAAATTPPETYAILNQYYGVTDQDLLSFYLNTEETEAALTKRYTAARIGTEAARQQFGVDVSTAELLAQQGVTVDEANKGFGVAANRSAFMTGAGETASKQDIVGSVFGDQTAANTIERIAKSRTGAFQQGGSFIQGKEGTTGLGSAATL